MLYYLASPYGHPDPAMQEERFRLACNKAAQLLLNNIKTFSPIAHSHPVAKTCAPQDHAFWMKLDLEILTRCDGIILYLIPGWEASKGMRMELQCALKMKDFSIMMIDEMDRLSSCLTLFKRVRETYSLDIFGEPL